MTSDFSTRAIGRAALIGIAVSLITAVFMIAMTRAGLAPFPKPPSLAFAETVLGRALPLPAGLAFHTAYVTAWSMIFVLLFTRRSLIMALLLATVLWVGVLVVFFPVVGWGLFGQNIGPQLIPGSLVPHLIFGVGLWALDRLIPAPSARDTNRGA